MSPTTEYELSKLLTPATHTHRREHHALPRQRDGIPGGGHDAREEGDQAPADEGQCQVDGGELGEGLQQQAAVGTAAQANPHPVGNWQKKKTKIWQKVACHSLLQDDTS